MKKERFEKKLNEQEKLFARETENIIKENEDLKRNVSELRLKIVELESLSEDAINLKK